MSQNDSIWNNFSEMEEGFRKAIDTVDKIPTLKRLPCNVAASTLYSQLEGNCNFNVVGDNECHQDMEPSLWRDIKYPFSKIINSRLHEYKEGWFGLLLLDQFNPDKSKRLSDHIYTLLALDFSLDDYSLIRHEKLFREGIPMTALGGLNFKQKDEVSTSLYPVFVLWNNNNDSKIEYSCEPAIFITINFKLPDSPISEEWGDINTCNFSIFGNNINEVDVSKVIYDRVKNQTSCEDSAIEQKIAWMVAHSVFCCKKNTDEQYPNSLVLACIPGSKNQGSSIAIVLTLKAQEFIDESEKIIQDIVFISRSLASPFEFMWIGEKAKVVEKRQAVTKMLHHMPKDLYAHLAALSRFSKKLQSFRKKEPDIPQVPSANALGVTTMFMKAQVDQLCELPEECVEITAGEWNFETISKFVELVVNDQIDKRVTSNEKFRNAVKRGDVSKSSSSTFELHKEHPRPKLILKTPFKVSNDHGIYPLLLISLRNSFEHSYLKSILDEEKIQGEVEISYFPVENMIEIANTGLEQNPTLNQEGITRDLESFARLCKPWTITDFGDFQFSRFDSEREKWITQIKYIK